MSSGWLAAGILYFLGGAFFYAVASEDGEVGSSRTALLVGSALWPLFMILALLGAGRDWISWAPTVDRGVSAARTSEAPRRAADLINHIDALGFDPVERPRHYASHPSGVECVEVAEAYSFLRGNAIKYLWRAGEKGDLVEDLRKARWYVDREIAREERRRAAARS